MVNSNQAGQLGWPEFSKRILVVILWGYVNIRKRIKCVCFFIVHLILVRPKLCYHPTTTLKQKTPAPSLIQDGAFFAVGPVGSEATSGSCTSGVVLTTNMMLQKKSTWSPKKRPEILSHKLFIWVCMYTLLGTGRRCPRFFWSFKLQASNQNRGHVVPGIYFRAARLHFPPMVGYLKIVPKEWILNHIFWCFMKYPKTPSSHELCWGPVDFAKKQVSFTRNHWSHWSRNP